MLLAHDLMAGNTAHTVANYTSGGNEEVPCCQGGYRTKEGPEWGGTRYRVSLGFQILKFSKKTSFKNFQILKIFNFGKC